MKKTVNLRLLFSFAAVIGLTLVLWTIIPHTYYVNDDRMMMQFVSGRFTGEPEPYCIYMGFMLSWVLSKAYTLCPDVDWYVFLLLSCNVVSLLIHLYYVVKKLTFRRKAEFVYPIITVVNFLVFYACGYITPTYTITCAMICFTMITVAALGEYSNKDIAALSIMCLFAYNLRAKCFIMCFPLLLLFLIYRLLHCQREQSKRVKTTILFLCVIIGGSAAVTECAYSRREWKAFMDYNEARTEVYDYAMQGDTEQVKAYITSHVDIDPIEYSCMLQYNLLLEPGLEERMFEISELYHNNKADFANLAGTEQTYAVYRYLIVWAVLLAGVAMVFAEKECFWKLLSVWGCTTIVIFLFAGGRIPERVINPAISMIALASVLWLIISCAEQKRVRLEPVMVLMILAAGVMVSFVMVRDTKSISERKQKDNEQYEVFIEYCQNHPENVYFLSHTSLPGSYNYSLIDENCKLGYVELGNWDAYSPLSDKMLKSYGIDDVRSYLETQDNARLAVAQTMNTTEGHFEWLTYTLPESWTYTLEDVVGVYEIYSINRN